MKQENYTIIGSGIGALTAGAILARQGHKVSVYEKFNQLGGYATLFKRKGFTFDVSLHQIGGIHKGGLHKILKASGIYDRLTYLKHPYLTELETAEGEKISIPNGDVRAYKAMLNETFPSEKKCISRWFRLMKQYGDQAKLQAKRYRSTFHQALIDLFSPLLIPLLISGIMGRRTLSQSCKVSNPALQKLLTHFSLYYGLPAEEANQLFPMFVNYGYFYHGGYYIKGGGHSMAQTLAQVIEENGGTIHTKSEVTTIKVEDKQAKSITINNATVIPVDKLIMSGSPHLLYGKLLKGYEPAKEALQKISGNQISMTASVLYVGIDCPIEVLNPELKSSYQYTYESPLSESAFYNLFSNKRDFEGDYSQWPLSISIHSNIDADCLPSSGGCCFDLFIADNYKRWDALTPEVYRKQKEIEIEKLLDKLNEKLPGIREHLIVAELGTPKTMERYTGNPKGAIYGFAQDVPQTMFRRMSAQSIVKNIQFASAWTRPGGGYEGAMESGYLLAHKSRLSGYLLMALLIALSIVIPQLFQ